MAGEKLAAWIASSQPESPQRATQDENPQHQPAQLRPTIHPYHAQRSHQGPDQRLVSTESEVNPGPRPSPFLCQVSVSTPQPQAACNWKGERRHAFPRDTSCTDAREMDS